MQSDETCKFPLRELCSKAAKDAEQKLLAAAGFVYSETIILGLILTTYGLLTFVFSDELWLGSVKVAVDNKNLGIYDTAFEVPWAPESWGTCFVVIGVTLLIANFKGWGGAIVCSAMAGGFIFLFFSISFFTDVIDGKSVAAWPPAIIYIGLASFCANRARLAWVWKK